MSSQDSSDDSFPPRRPAGGSSIPGFLRAFPEQRLGADGAEQGRAALGSPGDIARATAPQSVGAPRADAPAAPPVPLGSPHDTLRAPASRPHAAPPGAPSSTSLVLSLAERKAARRAEREREGGGRRRGGLSLAGGGREGGREGLSAGLPEARPEPRPGGVPLAVSEAVPGAYPDAAPEALPGGEGRRSRREREAAREAYDDEDDEDGGGRRRRRGRKDRRGRSDADALPMPVAPPVAPGRPQPRHWLALASFLLCVLVPTAVAAWYMWTRAADRYASTTGFSVRAEESNSSLDMMSGLSALTGGTPSPDTDILHEFIQSQEIVALVDARLDLRSLWSQPVAQDPVFAYHAPGTIEDLHEQWGRMVAVYADSGTGLLTIETQAFRPADATAIARAIYDESQTLINRLSAIAQDDTTRYAREELDTAVERLKSAREALTRFRNENQIVDPAASIQSQMGLLASLESQLAQTLIDLDILRQTAPESDPRIEQATRRIAVIETRLGEERRQLGLGSRTPALVTPPDADGAADASGAEADPAPPSERADAFADIVAEYERLRVDHDFASQAYTAALAAYDAAVAESRRQSRYLAAHIQPTLSESAAYPNRGALTALTALFAFLAWTILTLAAYALRDRR